MNQIIDFNEWICDNNVNPILNYSKGWWDYIEFARRLGEKINAKITVVDTYIVNTPPPEEVLTMPLIMMETEDYKFYIKENFSYSGFVDAWLMSVETKSGDAIHPSVDKYLNQISQHEHMISATNSDFIFEDYNTALNNIKFSGTVDDELDLYACIKFIINN